jgi:hypothetical protein
MITADTLKQMTTLGTYALAQILATSGYSGARFKTAKFLGLTNGGEFCYQVTFHDEEGTGKDAVGKVFVKYDPAANKVSAEY